MNSAENIYALNCPLYRTLPKAIRLTSSFDLLASEPHLNLKVRFVRWPMVFYSSRTLGQESTENIAVSRTEGADLAYWVETPQWPLSQVCARGAGATLKTNRSLEP
jgi:hypothetical protein